MIKSLDAMHEYKPHVCSTIKHLNSTLVMWECTEHFLDVLSSGFVCLSELADDATMTSYPDDHQTPKHNPHHQRHHYQQQQSFFDELHHHHDDLATPLPDLCPRDLHVTGSTDDYFRLSEDDGVGGSGGRVCAGCMVPIRDRHYLSAVGSNWHVSCLVCCECRRALDRQSTCYVHDARIYCRDDYFASVPLSS